MEQAGFLMELVNDGGGGLHRPVADLFGGVVTQHRGDLRARGGPVMNNTIKMVLHCGKRTIELDESTLYDTGALRALANYFLTTAEQNNANLFWTEVFTGLADLAHEKSCHEAIAGEQFRQHIQRLNNGGRDPYSPTLRKKLDQMAAD